jgi:hypothetical protein
MGAGDGRGHEPLLTKHRSGTHTDRLPTRENHEFIAGAELERGAVAGDEWPRAAGSQSLFTR